VGYVLLESDQLSREIWVKEAEFLAELDRLKNRRVLGHVWPPPKPVPTPYSVLTDFAAISFIFTVLPFISKIQNHQYEVRKYNVS